MGAGPQGLTAAVYLARAGVQPHDMVVVDPSGEWLHEWHRWFAHLGITHLRSAGVHHPDPDPYAVMKWAREMQRSAELFERYGLPGTRLFADFCTQVIEECAVADIVWADEVVGATAHGVLHLAGGAELRAEHVVWATNPSVRPQVWPEMCTPGLKVAEWDVVDVDAAGEAVAVVGGGLTAAHLVERAVERGRQVWWLTRRPIETRDFDTDPGWLGPLNMSGFDQLENPHDRMSAVLAARGGGTVPSWMMRRLSGAEAAGSVVCRVGQISLGHDSDGGSVVCVDDEPLAVDEVWRAAGDRPEVMASAALGDLCAALEVPVVMGRPVLDSSLRLPGSVVQVMGRLAQVRLGPAAGNLAGARRGAEKVVADVVGIDAMYRLLDV